MKLKAIAILIVTGGMISHSALAGTTSATLTVDSIVTMGTCTAQLLDSNDKEISQVAIGDVYISELRNETNKKAFKIRFSGCAGLPQKKALVKLTPRGIGCGGYNANSADLQMQRMVRAQQEELQLKYGLPKMQKLKLAVKFLIVLAPQIKRLTFLPSLRRNISIMI